MSALDDIRDALAIARAAQSIAAGGGVDIAPRLARADVALIWLGELFRTARRIHIDHDGEVPVIAGIAALHEVLDRIEDGVQT